MISKKDSKFRMLWTYQVRYRKEVMEFSYPRSEFTEGKRRKSNLTTASRHTLTSEATKGRDGYF